MASLCAFCYSPNVPKLCGRCRKRAYCSKECQVDDWKTAAHKRYCGKSAEIGFDFEVRESPNKGLGVFAKRDFKRGEKVIVERPLVMMSKSFLNYDPPDIPEAAKNAVEALVPEGSALMEKIRKNRIGCGDVGTGLFVNFSRLNHDCVGNTFHYYLAGEGVNVLVCSRDVSSGEEFLFSYCGDHHFRDNEDRRYQLKITWDFDCQCLACTDDNIGDKLVEIGELSNDLLSMDPREALIMGEIRLKLYKELNYSLLQLAKTYFELFVISVSNPKLKNAAHRQDLAKQAAAYAEMTYGDDHILAKMYGKLPQLVLPGVENFEVAKQAIMEIVTKTTKLHSGKAM